MQLLCQIPLLWVLSDKILHNLQLRDTSRFKATRVMENKPRVAAKNHLILDIMFSTLNNRVQSACDGQIVWMEMNDVNRWFKDGDLNLDCWIVGFLVASSSLRSKHTFSPCGVKISGSSIVLQTLWRIVVFPAFARPIMRIRNRGHCLRILRMRSSAEGDSLLDDIGSQEGSSGGCFGRETALTYWVRNVIRWIDHWVMSELQLTLGSGATVGDQISLQINYAMTNG